jgi:hypothetical protein
MKKATVIANFKSDIKKVWGIVTDNQNYSWRSDINKIEVFGDGRTFIEYDKNNFPTTFTITMLKPCERYEFDIANKNITGHWTGVFVQIGDETQIVFTEEISVNNPVMNLFIGYYLKKQQTAYIKDLRKALQE